MNQAEKLAIYRAQTQNVRSLRADMQQVRRVLNESLRLNNTTQTVAFTKIYALTFCSWAEANFSKVLHTPYGFSLSEIAQVQAAKANGIAMAWKKCLHLGLRHLDARRGSFLPNTKKKIESLVDLYVFDPASIRNKLAHGQWVIALNRTNEAVNKELTEKLLHLDLVKIERWISGHLILSSAVETLIESPNRAFMRDWNIFVADIEEQFSNVNQRTIEIHIANLLQKFDASNARAKRGHSIRA